MDLTAFMNISSGMYLVTVQGPEYPNGQIVNALIQVSADPQTLAIRIHKKNYSHELINKSQKFAISILSENTPLEFIENFGRYSGRKRNKFKNLNFILYKNEIPVVEVHNVGYFIVNVIQQYDMNDSTIFMTEVIDSKTISSDKPMTFDYYREVLSNEKPESNS